MRTSILAFSLCCLAAPAFADCVDYNRSAHQAAAARLAADPPAAAALGLPSLDGFTLDAMGSTDDPGCATPRADGTKRYVFTTGLSSVEVLDRLHPFVAAKTTVDGMNRSWYANPMGGHGQFLLTSGTEVEIPQSHTATNVKVVVLAPAAPAALTTASQPYSVKDMLDGTPWVGGVKNNWVQVGQAPAVAAASSSAPAAPSTTNTNSAKAACEPKSGQSAEAAGKEIGGAVLGGGWGRSVGGMIGGALGGSGKKNSGAAGDCP